MNKLYKVVIEYNEDFDMWQLVLYYVGDHNYIKLFDSLAQACFFADQHQTFDFTEEEPK